MIVTKDGEVYFVPNEIVAKAEKYDKIVRVLQTRSPYGENRKTCDMIREICGKDGEYIEGNV